MYSPASAQGFFAQVLLLCQESSETGQILVADASAEAKNEAGAGIQLRSGVGKIEVITVVNINASDVVGNFLSRSEAFGNGCQASAGTRSRLTLDLIFRLQLSHVFIFIAKHLQQCLLGLSHGVLAILPSLYHLMPSMSVFVIPSLSHSTYILCCLFDSRLFFH